MREAVPLAKPVRPLRPPQDHESPHRIWDPQAAKINEEPSAGQHRLIQPLQADLHRHRALRRSPLVRLYLSL